MRTFNLKQFSSSSSVKGLVLKSVTTLPKGIENPEFKALVLTADTEYYDGIVSRKILEDAVLFIYNGKLVGFNIPRLSRVVGGEKIIRVGPIFVIEKYRGKGIAAEYLKVAFTNIKAEAHISPNNQASRATFEAAGFTVGDGGKLVIIHDEPYLHYKNF